MRKLLVYLAAPLFNDRERDFNASVATRISKFADVFLPQRDGSLLVNMLEAGIDLSVAERRVFEQDRAALHRADLLVALLDGAHLDEGVAFELGFASALGCLCVGLQTDARRTLPTGNNPMISGGLDEIFSNLDNLVAWVEEKALESDHAQTSAAFRA